MTSDPHLGLAIVGGERASAITWSLAPHGRSEVTNERAGVPSAETTVAYIHHSGRRYRGLGVSKGMRASDRRLIEDLLPVGAK
jgi:hypothetical protein